MPRQLDQLPADATTLAREVATLKREMRELRASRRASYTALASGGFKVYQPGSSNVAAEMLADLGDGNAGFQTNSADGTRFARLEAGELIFGSPDIAQAAGTGISARPEGGALDITSGLIDGGNQAHIILASADSPLAGTSGAPLILLEWDGPGTTQMIVDISGVLLPRSMAWGTVSITPSAANTPTSAVVSGLNVLGTTFTAQISANTSLPGTQVTGVSFNNLTSSGLTIWLTRTNTTTTTVNWLVIGS
ncbi:hypothetical protein [Streptomyces sp. NBC_00847]|uniref:hypothetical protein n=1 Tax=Streptomyces sp. NBC_00847 TaxID=2975850 RepID=UPI00225DDD71|nr:hypothetical protein [Streptomyces sp. NBC_00847]MCX4886088.1 hypothetical protein [Streptomyces sp. NBC_00847]